MKIQPALKNQLRLVRQAEALPNTWWRPLSHVERDGERLSVDQLRDLMNSTMLLQRAIEVEDPYERGRWIGGFGLSSMSLAVVALRGAKIDSAVEGAGLGPLSVIWAKGRIADEVTVGSFSEVRQGVILRRGVHIGDRSVIGKYVSIDEGSKVGSAIYIGNYTTIGADASVGTGTMISQDCQVGKEVEIGMQNNLARRVALGEAALLGDSVHIARDSRIHAGVTIGDEAMISAYTVINERAIIGAGAQVGTGNELAPSAWILAGQVVPDRIDPRRLLLPRHTES